VGVLSTKLSFIKVVSLQTMSCPFIEERQPEKHRKETNGSTAVYTNPNGKWVGEDVET